VLCSLQDHLRTGTRDLDHPVLAGAKNTDSWRAMKWDLQRAFPLDVLIIPSFVITITTDGERLTCGGFSLGETVRLGSFEFITDYFSGLSLSPKRGDSSAALMGLIHSGAPSPQQAMIEDNAEFFLMSSSVDGGFGLLSPRRHGMGAPPTPVTTTPWMENVPATQTMMMVPPRMTVPWPNTGLPFEQCRARQGRQQVQAHAR
jgi:hypothetical protein